MKTYRLKTWYPSLPKDWEIGMDIGQGDRGEWENFSPCNGKYTDRYLPFSEINNNEFWEEVVEKDYEILSFLNTSCNVIVKKTDCCMYDEDFYLEAKHFNIHSVKRVNDGEIFTVGDLCYPSSVKSNIGIINFIEFCKAGYLRFRARNWYIGLENIQHSKKPLFVTFDGVEIYGDSYYCSVVRSTLTLLSYKVYGNEDILTFSTREKAEEYILFNKPCLSLNDVFKVYPQIKRKEPFVNTAHANELINIVKKKL